MDSNLYDERYVIRLANKQDIDLIMSFIGTKWVKNHILSIDRTLFEYEFCEDDNVNMVLAINRNTNNIEGILGFLRCSQTDDYEKKAVWGSIWKVDDSADAIPFLGIELAKRVYKLSGARYFIGNGANPRTSIRLRKLFFHSNTVKLNQHYVYNHKMSVFQLAEIVDFRKITYIDSSDVTIHRLDGINDIDEFIDLEKCSAIPYKDMWYINKRFFRHPYYKYTAWGIEDKTSSRALVITREVCHGDAKALRIVDYYGDQNLFAFTGDFWYQIMDDFAYEYIDFYEYGFDQGAIEKAGFYYRNDDDNNIIPNYYEPFVKKNVDIWGHFEEKGTLIFKADGDQDRPNIMR